MEGRVPGERPTSCGAAGSYRCDSSDPDAYLSHVYHGETEYLETVIEFVSMRD